MTIYRQWRRNEFESGGHRCAAKRRENFFGDDPPPLFGSKSTISRFGKRFGDGQYSLVSFLFAVLLYSRCPPCLAICKSGGHVPPCPMESAPLFIDGRVRKRNRNKTLVVCLVHRV